jgi:hypothetical protein
MLSAQEMGTFQKPIAGENDFVAAARSKKRCVIPNPQVDVAPAKILRRGCGDLEDALQDGIFGKASVAHWALPTFQQAFVRQYNFLLADSGKYRQSSLYEGTGNRFGQPVLRNAKYRVDGHLYRI